MTRDTITSAHDPLETLLGWLDDARAAGVDLPEAVCLATATPDGIPSARMVLFRGVEDGGLAFYTDYRSRKARELESNPHAALVFHWSSLERQVRIEGTVARLPAEVSDRYFSTRPRGSRLAVWASEQSAPLDARESLNRRYGAAAERFRNGPVPRPEFWGGYVLDPSRIEFWVGRRHRLHDRFVFDRAGDGWSFAVLQP